MAGKAVDGQRQHTAEPAVFRRGTQRGKAARAPEQQHEQRQHRRRALHEGIGLQRADVFSEARVHHALNAHRRAGENTGEKSTQKPSHPFEEILALPSGMCYTVLHEANNCPQYAHKRRLPAWQQATNR